MNSADALMFVVWTLFVALFAALLGASAAENRWEAELISRNLALYCPQDGEWAWKGECDD